MPSVRRSADRRRRVLYQTHAEPPSSTSGPSSRSKEDLRAARQPAKTFGSRVRQPLRGKWFSLVPVATIPMAALATLLIAVPVLLAIAHHVSVTWSPLALRADVARPLRIDLANGFAAWWQTMIITLSAGIVYLVYQLRRHRNDDYRGHYRLWRVALIAMLLASVSSVAGLVSWCGALIELVFGNRVALSGENWLRLLLDVGGIILAMRLVAEVRRCRPAMILMIVAGIELGLAEAVAWKLMKVESYGMSTMVLAAPMLGFSCFAVACTFYLRLLYRQARNIPDEAPLRERLVAWFESVRQKDDEPMLPLEELPPALPAGAQLQVPIQVDSWPGNRRRKRRAAKQATEKESQSTDATENRSNQARESGRHATKSSTPSPERSSRRPAPPAEPHSASDGDPDATSPKPKRRWFGLRGPKKPDAAVDENASSPKPEKPQKPLGREEADSPEAADDASPKKRRRLFGLLPRRLESPSQSADDDSDSTSETAGDTASETPDTPKAKRGLGSFFKRKSTATDEAPNDAENVADTNSRDTTNRGSTAGGTQPSGGNPNHASDDINEDDIDWDSLSKSERRRLRKRLRRSGRAA